MQSEFRSYFSKLSPNLANSFKVEIESVNWMKPLSSSCFHLIRSLTKKPKKQLLWSIYSQSSKAC